MKNFNYIPGGDITNPVNTGKDICIAHCVNDIWIMGAGVAKALYTKWPNVRSEYLQLSKTSASLGDVQFVNVDDNIVVANLIGQHGISFDCNGNPPIRYNALDTGFSQILKFCQARIADLHIPYKLGCDLAGGNWNTVEIIIRETVLKQDIDVYVYDKFFQKK